MMDRIKLRPVLAAALLTLGGIATLFACSDDGKPTEQNVGKFDAGNPEPTVDGSVTGDAGKDCFDTPQTHEEIINACSTHEKVDKKPVLPLLPADGKLPPLP